MSNGYLTCTLYKNSKPKIFLIHRLVAGAFIPNTENKPEINHINAIRSDNRVGNLEWCTHSANMKHMINIGHANGGHIGKFGGESPTSKRVIQYDINGNLIKKHNSFVEASFAMSVSINAIRQCAIGKSKTCAGYMWRYELDINK
jgi:hypothetical protein